MQITTEAHSNLADIIVHQGVPIPTDFLKIIEKIAKTDTIDISEPKKEFLRNIFSQGISDIDPANL